MDPTEAETIGARALAWLAGREDLIGVFLGATGASSSDIGALAESPEFLAAVLDFVIMDDAWVTGFCDAAGLAYDAPVRARAALPGGQQVHWT